MMLLENDENVCTLSPSVKNYVYSHNTDRGLVDEKGVFISCRFKSLYKYIKAISEVGNVGRALQVT